MTDKELGDILDSVVVIVDTREQKNAHITSYLIANEIPYVERKLDTGDYSFFLKGYGYLGLDESVLVERKNSWNEIIGNFTSGRERFVNEFERIGEGVTMHVVIEGATLTQLYNQTYRSKVPPQSILASLLTFNIRYDAHVWFPRVVESPRLIHNLLYYGLREKLKNMQSAT